MNPTDFLNEFASNPVTLLVIAAALAIALVLFGVIDNAVMNRRKSDDGYTAFYVVGGVLVTLAAVAVISWKAAMLSLFGFVFSGLPMVIGAMLRSTRERGAGNEHKAKRLPYKANGLVKDAADLLFDAGRLLQRLIEENGRTPEETVRMQAKASVRVNDARAKLIEVQNIQ